MRFGREGSFPTDTSYLDAEKNPGSLMVTCDPPKPDTAHMCKKFNGQYYWVPIEYRKLFFQLTLSTTAQRGKAFQAPDKFFAVKLDDSPIFDEAKSTLSFNIAKQKIPIDVGCMTLDNDTPAPPAAPTQFDIETVAAPTTPGSVAPSQASTLVVYLPNDPIQLELVKDDNEPKGQPNLFHVSLVSDMLHFRIYNGKGELQLDKKESQLTGIDELKKIAELKPLVKNALEKPQLLDNRAKNTIIELVTKLFNIQNSKMALFQPLYPKTAKVFLKQHAPTVPTTEDALNRVNFQLQQIQFNQLRPPSM